MRIFNVLILCFIAGSTLLAQEHDSFGEQINAEDVISYEDLISALDEQDSVQTKIKANIENVCQMKGCWMNVYGTDKDNQIHVKFKDYGFFVPKDAGGREVIMEGVAYRTVTPVEELQHYAQDAGKSDEEIAKITEPKEEIRFVASGVLIKK